MTDPDAYPTPEEDCPVYEDDEGDDMGDIHEDDEWRPGTCDRCAGHAGGTAELAAALASSIVPVCACAIGQGALPSACECGPQ